MDYATAAAAFSGYVFGFLSCLVAFALYGLSEERRERKIRRREDYLYTEIIKEKNNDNDRR